MSTSKAEEECPPWNILDMSVTEETSQLDISPLKAVAY
jgi:hypothetical protein